MGRYRVYGFAGNRYTYVRVDGVGGERAAPEYVRKRYPHFDVNHMGREAVVVKCP